MLPVYTKYNLSSNTSSSSKIYNVIICLTLYVYSLSLYIYILCVYVYISFSYTLGAVII